MASLLAGEEVFHFAEVNENALPCQMHRHDFVEFFWVTRGSGAENRLNENRALAVGDYAFVSQGDVHGFDSTQGLCFSNVAFPHVVWKTLLGRYPTLGPDRFASNIDMRQGRLSSAELDQLNAASESMRQGGRDALVLDTFLLTAHRLTQRSEAQRANVPAWLRDAVERKHLQREGVLGLTQSCGYSREYVARACQRYFGKTPTQLVTEARMVGAVRLLEQTEKSVLEVCFESGFQNVGHFHQRFKQMFGVTPRRYRLRYRGVTPRDARG